MTLEENPPHASAADEGIELDDDEVTLKSTDIVIAVMGVTGVGKSSFIKHFNQKAVVGQGLESETSVVQTLPATINGKKFYLVDTPGFDDTHISDIDVLRRVADWLNRTHQAKVKLAGIVYLHRITDPRLGGSGMKNLRMFKQLCGADAMSSVVLATTMWEKVDPEIAKRREQQLVSNEEFWAGMIKNGSKVLRQYDEVDSANKIIEYILAQRRTPSLKIQEEMSTGKTLDETAAGLEVEAEKAKLRAKHKEEMIQLEKERKEALAEKDVAAAKEIAGIKAELEAKMKKESEEMERLRVTNEQLRVQRDAEMQHDRQQAFDRQLALVTQIEQQKGENQRIMAAHGYENRLTVAEWEMKLGQAREKALKLAAKNERAKARAKAKAQPRPKPKVKVEPARSKRR